MLVWTFFVKTFLVMSLKKENDVGYNGNFQRT